MLYDLKDRLNHTPLYGIAEIRKALSLTQKEFSLMLDVPIGTLRYWEQDRGKPPAVVTKLLNLIIKNESGSTKIKILRVKPNYRRIITGELISMMEVDWLQPLTNLKQDAEYAISLLMKRPLFGNLFMKSDEISVYQGFNYLEMMINGKKSTEWFFVRDYLLPQKYYIKKQVI